MLFRSDDAAAVFTVLGTAATNTAFRGVALAPGNDLIFADGFESGDLSAWSASAIDAGDLGVTAAAGLVATAYGLQAQVNDTAGLYVQDDTPNDQPRYRARFYFDPHGFDPGTANGAYRTRLFIGFQESPNRRLFAVVLKYKNGQYSVMARTRQNDGAQVDTGFFDISSAPSRRAARSSRRASTWP